MTPLERLPPEMAERIDRELAQAGEAWRSGDAERGVRHQLAAWSLIPDPKDAWDYYPQIVARGLVVRLRDAGRYDDALRWVGTMRTVYGPGEASDDSVDFLEGTVLFEAGRVDEASARLASIHRKLGSRFFSGANARYLAAVPARRGSK